MQVLTMRSVNHTFQSLIRSRLKMHLKLSFSSLPFLSFTHDNLQKNSHLASHLATSPILQFLELFFYVSSTAFVEEIRLPPETLHNLGPFGSSETNQNTRMEIYHSRY